MPRRSSDYWRERQEEIARLMAAKADEVERELIDAYNKAIESIRHDIELFYARYAKTDGISMAEARKLLSKSELRGWKMTLDEFRDKALDNADGRWSKLLDSEYIKSRVSRLETLQTQIRGEVELLKQRQEHATKALMSGTYIDSYYRTAYEISKGFGYVLSFSRLDTEAVEKAVYTKWLDGKNFSDRIWVDKDKLLRELDTILRQGIIRGDAPDNMIRQLSQRMGVSRNNAAVLVQTESANIMEMATADMYKEIDVEQYDYLGTLDLHTCEICGAMDGKTFRVSERETGINYPPLHPRCRCTTVPHIDDEVAGTRAARDPQTGKTVQVPGDMTYRQWRTRVDYQADAEQWQEFSRVVGQKNIPNDLESFREMKYNNPEGWNKLMRHKKLFDKIDSTERYSPEYKQKLKDTYQFFKDNGFEFTEHGLNRTLGQRAKKDIPDFTKEKLLEILHMEPRYQEGSQKLVKYKDNIGVIYARDTGEIISVVKTKNPKDLWKEAEK